MLNSSLTRSADTIFIRSDISVAANKTSTTGVKPNWLANLAARIMRNGSSEKDSSGSRGVRITRLLKSSIPPNGSTNVSSGNLTAMALIVKSRRIRSSSSEEPKLTSGLRLSSL